MMWRTHILRAASALLPTQVIDTVSATDDGVETSLETAHVCVCATSLDEFVEMQVRMPAGDKIACPTSRTQARS